MSFWIQYPNLQFNEKTHVYTWNGRVVPSVTQVFDSIGYRKNDTLQFNPIGCPDFAKRQHDADFGNAFHKMANYITIGKSVEIPESMIDWQIKLERFLNKYQLIPVFDLNGNHISEYPLYSVILRFCGTPDLLCREIKSGKLWLIDWKTSAKYHKIYGAQTGAYSRLVKEVFGGNIFDIREKIIRKIVLFSADKDFPEIVTRTETEDLINFQSIFNTYKLAA